MPDTKLVTTKQLADYFKTTKQAILHRMCRGQWPIKPVEWRGRAAIWSLSEAQATAPEALRSKVGMPAIRLHRPDGWYISIPHLAGRRPDETGTVPQLPGGKEETICGWIDEGCELLPLENGKLRRLVGHEEFYTLADRKQRYRHRYVREQDYKKAVGIRAGEIEPAETDRQKMVSAPEARRITGLGPKLFKQFVEDPDECRKLIGHKAERNARPTITKHAVRPGAIWNKKDMEDVRDALREKAKEHPTYFTEAKSRERHPRLPQSPSLGACKNGTKFLPDGREIHWLPNVLRRRRDGSYEYQDVYEDEDVAAIEQAWISRVRAPLSRDAQNRWAKGSGEVSVARPAPMAELPEPARVVPPPAPRKADGAEPDWKMLAEQEGNTRVSCGDLARRFKLNRGALNSRLTTWRMNRKPGEGWYREGNAASRQAQLLYLLKAVIPVLQDLWRRSKPSANAARDS